MLPVIIGGSLVGKKNKLRPFIITGSLFVSLVLFTLLLKVSTIFLGVPQQVWRTVSGVIILLFGLVTLWPALWEKLAIRFNLASNNALSQSAHTKGHLGDVLIGASLGPVFSSCSPVYAVILATILPQSLSRGVLYIVAYSLGLSLALLLIARFGQALVVLIKPLSNPNGWFKRGLGILLLIVGLLIITGYDKRVQLFLLSKGYVNITTVEERLIR